jgi:hypothetical protein
VSHRNARLNEYGRLLIVRRIEQGHSKSEIAKQLGVSRPTVHKWWNRYLDEGLDGLQDRSSQPHGSPRRLSRDTVRRIVVARLLHFAGPIALSGVLDLPASTIGLVLRREGLPRLSDIDRITGEVIRGRRHSEIRYEHSEPGSLLHVDVKKLGKIPPGGGWRAHGRSEAVRGRGLGYDYVHVAGEVRHLRGVPAPRRQLVPHPPPGHNPPGPDRQRQGLPGRRRLDPGLQRPADPTAVHQGPQPLDQRQSRTLQPHPAHRMGLRQSVDQQRAPRQGPGQLPRALQHSPQPLRARRTPTDQPSRRVNNVRAQYS